MKIAAEAGIAVAGLVHEYGNRGFDHRFRGTKPFPDLPAQRIADTIRRLHSLPPFPRAVNYLGSIGGFVRRFQSAKILPESATEHLFRLYEWPTTTSA